MIASDPDPPSSASTPTKSTENDGAHANNQMAPIESDSSIDSDLQVAKKRKKNQGHRYAEWIVIKKIGAPQET